MSDRSVEILGLAPGTWDAVATLLPGLGILIGALAAAVAVRQYGLNRRIRDEQARPYMVMSAESGTSTTIIDLVIKNIGSTPARELTIRVEPPFQRANEVPGYPIMGTRMFSETLPIWPPGQERRIFFDTHIERAGKGLPGRHEIEFSYVAGTVDSRPRWWRTASREAKVTQTRRERLRVTERFTVDIELTRGALTATVYGVHDAAKALREIATMLKKRNPA